MFKQIFRFSISAILLLNLYAANNEMYFAVDSLHMTKKDGSSRLEGLVRAKKVFVVMDDNEFDIELENDEVFEAKTYLEKDKFTFFKDGIKFSTPLNSSNPVLRINHLEVDQADVHLNDKGICVKGEKLKTHIDRLDFYADNLDMTCNTDEFSTNIEKSCVKNVKIIPDNGYEFSFISATDINEPKKFGITIKSKNVEIKEDKLSIDSEDIKGFLDTTKFELGRGYLKCYKDPLLQEIDVEKIIMGCFYESKIDVDDFKYQQSGVNLKISKALIYFRNEDLKVKADYASFRQSNETTYVSGMELYCIKEVVTTKSKFTQNTFLNGCLKRSTFKIANIQSEGLTFEEFVQENEKKDFKNLVVDIDKGKFKISIKPKFIFRVPVEIEGSISLKALTNSVEIVVKEANVAGVPSKNYALKLIKKFIDNDRVKIKDNVITIEI